MSKRSSSSFPFIFFFFLFTYTRNTSSVIRNDRLCGDAIIASTMIKFNLFVQAPLEQNIKFDLFRLLRRRIREF